MQTLHAKLKWVTIVNRINKACGFDKLRLDQYGSIYAYNDKHHAYLFIAKTHFDKQDFIEQYA